MIRDAEEIVAGWPFVARRLGLSVECNEHVVRAAVAHARELATDPLDAPAAVFFAFACRPRAFPGGWRSMSAMLAFNEVAEQGQRLRATRDEFDNLCMQIVTRTATFDAIRAWFVLRLTPQTGGDEPTEGT